MPTHFDTVDTSRTSVTANRTTRGRYLRGRNSRKSTFPGSESSNHPAARSPLFRHTGLCVLVASHPRYIADARDIDFSHRSRGPCRLSASKDRLTRTDNHPTDRRQTDAELDRVPGAHAGSLRWGLRGLNP